MLVDGRTLAGSCCCSEAVRLWKDFSLVGDHLISPGVPSTLLQELAAICRSITAWFLMGL